MKTLAERFLLHPEDADGWPTAPQSAEQANVSTIGVPQGWVAIDSPAGSAAWQGLLPAEGITATTIDDADAEAELADWARHSFALTGGTEPALQPAGVSARLLDWHEEKVSAAAAQHLDVEESALFEGLLALSTRPPEMVRVYGVLARRGVKAWKVVLQISSACPPGVDADALEANDDVRARAVLGQLALA